jgi:hypothetical protein
MTESGASSAARGASVSIPDRAAFVVGNARSGTSLLVSLLDGHPEVAMQPHESKVFEWCDAADPVAALFEVTVYDELFPEGSEERRTFEGELRARMPGPTEFGAALLAVTAALAAVKSQAAARVWMEKTPKHLRSLPLFMERFGPETRFVISVRDPRAVFASNAKRWDRRGVHEAHQFCRRWCTSQALTRRFLREYPEAILVVRYEDVVREPQAWLEKVAAHLEVTFDPSLLETSSFDRPWAGNSSFGATQGIGTDALDRWKDYLDRREIAIVESLTAPYMAEYGYERQVARPAWLLSPHRLRLAASLRYNLRRERRRWKELGRGGAS